MADIFTNITMAAFFSILIIKLIRDTWKDFSKNSSQIVEDATPKTTKEDI